MRVKSESEVAQSCPILSDSTDYSLPGSSVHGIFQARVLECGSVQINDFQFLSPSCYRNRNIRKIFLMTFLGLNI